MSIFSHTKKQWLVIGLLLSAVIIAAAALLVNHALWHTGFAETEDSFFSSPYLTGKTVLVLVAHSDDEANLAFGLIDSLVRAGSHVTVAIATNGDAQESSDVRAAEAVAAGALMGVPRENIKLLGYGDHMVPAYFSVDDDVVRTSEAGHTHTYGGAGIPDFHTLLYGHPAAYTRTNFELDIRRLLETLRPDLILTADEDYHIDHVSVSQLFDTVMGRLLRDDPTYRPTVLKGFCYDYAWYANDDFYNFLTLQSAVPQWNAAAYNTAFSWDERIRFPLPAEYLSYTLRSSKLRGVLLSYKSQDAVSREGRMLNADKLLWERRTDALWAHVTATSGNAALLQDFLISDSVEAPLYNCWMPDSGDRHAEIQFTWDTPQTVGEIVFYDAPPEAGDIQTVVMTDDTGWSDTYALPNGGGQPCRYVLSQPHAMQSLTVKILASEGSRIGLSEIEILPPRQLATQWIHLLDAEDNFIYEYPCPADTPFTLGLYGYPQVPDQATATVTREGKTTVIAEIPFDGKAFTLPALAKGRYRIRAQGGGCTVEALLRVGDSMLMERVYRFVERQASKILPD